MMFPLLLLESKWCCHLVAIKTRSFELNWLVFLHLVGCTVLYVERKKINKCSLELNLGTQKCCLPCRGGRAVSPSGSCTSPVMEHQLPCSGDGAPSSKSGFRLLFLDELITLTLYNPHCLTHSSQATAPTGLKYLLAVLITVLASM